MKKYSALIVSILFFSTQCFAISTSNWIPVKSRKNESKDHTNNNRKSYITLKYKDDRIYTKSKWWEKITKINNKAFTEVRISCNNKKNNSNLNATYTSRVIDAPKEGVFETGWAPIIIQNQPMAFDKLKIEIGLSTSSENALKNLLNKINANTETFSVFNGVQGVTAATNLILDSFKESDSNFKHKGFSDIHISGNSSNIEKEGLYVIFMGDSAKDYKKYEQGTLRWSNKSQNLKWNNEPIDKVSYIVIEVTYSDNRLESLDTIITENETKEWAEYYKEAINLVEQIKKTASQQENSTIQKNIDKKIALAQEFLDKDINYTYEDKRKAKEIMYNHIEKIIKKKYGVTLPIQNNEKPETS